MIKNYNKKQNNKKRMFANFKPSIFFKKDLQETTSKQQKPIEIKIKQKQTSSELIKQQKSTNDHMKLIKSQPQLEMIDEYGGDIKQTNKRKTTYIPRFVRTLRQSSPKKKPVVSFKYLSPPARIPALIHQPVQPQQSTQQTPTFKRQIIPPSTIGHSKMKNFQQNPQSFLLNLDLGLDKVFKKSVQSIIRTAEVVKVKDDEIRDSTNLLEGYTDEGNL